jgi:hypothetical protein
MRNKTDAQNQAPAFVRGGWVNKSRDGLTLLNVVRRRMPVRAQATVPVLAKDAETTTSTQKGRHCIVLHGWASSGDESRDLWAAVREMPEAESWHFWDITYDSQWTNFDESARRIVAALWIPVPNRGPRSISRCSALLSRLNRDPVDMAHRDRYHFFAITYEDALGQHEHDGIILASSALGLELGPIAQRERIHLRYRTVATFDAHWRGRFAAHIPPVVQTLRTLMQATANENRRDAGNVKVEKDVSHT